MNHQELFKQQIILLLSYMSILLTKDRVPYTRDTIVYVPTHKVGEIAFVLPQQLLAHESFAQASQLRPFYLMLCTRQSNF